MKICILNPSYHDSRSVFKTLNPLYDPTLYLKKHEWERHFISPINIFGQIEKLISQKFDIFFNLCDGAADQDIAGIEVVKALEFFNVAFTGAGSLFYEPSRKAMKLACQNANLLTPKYLFVNSLVELHENIKTKWQSLNLKFPLIVKHYNSYNSVGLSKKSVVHNVKDLEIETQKIIENFGSALIEEFIEGKEFTVLVAENTQNFTPVEFLFPKGETFKHFDLKWKDYETMQCLACENFVLSAELQRIATLFFEAMNGIGYARVDIRMNEKNEIYILEINPNCSIYYSEAEAGSADFILLQKPNGHQEFTDLLLKIAMNRIVK